MRAVNAEIARLTKLRDGLIEAGGENPYPRKNGRKKKRVVSKATRAKMRAAWAKRKKAQAAKK